MATRRSPSARSARVSSSLQDYCISYFTADIVTSWIFVSSQQLVREESLCCLQKASACCHGNTSASWMHALHIQFIYSSVSLVPAVCLHPVHTSWWRTSSGKPSYQAFFVWSQPGMRLVVRDPMYVCRLSHSSTVLSFTKCTYQNISMFNASNKYLVYRTNSGVLWSWLGLPSWHMISIH